MRGYNTLDGANTTEQYAMPLLISLRQVLPYASALGAGALVARFAAPSLLPPLFFLGIAVIAVLAIAAHRFSVPVQWGRAKKFAVAFLLLGLGPSSMETKSGPAPRLFLLSICFLLGFVLMLAIHGSAV
jgi:hypothetical protein